MKGFYQQHYSAVTGTKCKLLNNQGKKIKWQHIHIMLHLAKAAHPWAQASPQVPLSHVAGQRGHRTTCWLPGEGPSSPAAHYRRFLVLGFSLQTILVQAWPSPAPSRHSVGLGAQADVLLSAGPCVMSCLVLTQWVLLPASSPHGTVGSQLVFLSPPLESFFSCFLLWGWGLSLTDATKKLSIYKF